MTTVFFFELCQTQPPLQRMRDELKTYALRHNLADLAVPLKELYERYGVVENEQLQVSETCSHVPEEGTRSSDEDAKSSSSTMGTRKLKPKSLNTDAAQVSPVRNKAKKEIPQKGIPATRTRASVAKNSSASGPVSDSGVRRSTANKSQKPIKQEAKNEKDRKKQGNKPAVEQGKCIKLLHLHFFLCSMCSFLVLKCPVTLSNDLMLLQAQLALHLQSKHSMRTKKMRCLPNFSFLIHKTNMFIASASGFLFYSLWLSLTLFMGFLQDVASMEEISLTEVA